MMDDDGQVIREGFTNSVRERIELEGIPIRVELPEEDPRQIFIDGYVDVEVMSRVASSMGNRMEPGDSQVTPTGAEIVDKTMIRAWTQPNPKLPGRDVDLEVEDQLAAQEVFDRYVAEHQDEIMEKAKEQATDRDYDQPEPGY